MSFDFPRFALDHHIITISEGRGTTHVRPGWVGVRCPFCGSDHLGFDLEHEWGRFRCWKCGPHRMIETVQELARCSLDDAKGILKQYDTDRPRVGLVAPVARRREVPTPPHVGPLRARHIEYLRERGLTNVKLIIEEWELQGTSQLGGSWAWRVVSPIRDADGRLVAYVGRAIGDNKAKYRMTDDCRCAADPKSFLYGIHKAKGESVVVVEGPGDVWNVGPGAVATLGVDWHMEQVVQLEGFKRRYIMYDPEPMAQARALKLAGCFEGLPGRTVIISGLGSDPGSLSPAMIKRIRREMLE